MGCVISVQTFGRHSDQNPQGVGLDDCVHSLYIFDGEVVWDVHCLYWPLKNFMTEFLRRFWFTVKINF